MSGPHQRLIAEIDEISDGFEQIKTNLDCLRIEALKGGIFAGAFFRVCLEHGLEPMPYIEAGFVQMDQMAQEADKAGLQDAIAEIRAALSK